MATTPSAVISDALRRIMRLRTGQTAATNELNDGFTQLNRMLASWITQRALIYSETRVTQVLTPATQTYSIGATGTIVTPRPLAIHSANIITAAGAFVHPLKMVDEGAFTRPGRSRQAAMPLELWYQPNYPLGNIWLWPVPNAAATLELFLWSQLAQFVTLADSFDFPPGYELALVTNLAVAIAPMFSKTASPELLQEAAMSKAAISGLNAPPIPGAQEEAEALGIAPAGARPQQRG